MTHILLVVAVCLIWLSVAYGLLLAMASAWRARRGEARPSVSETGWPGVSVLVPAHDEEPVIEASLRTLLALDYPSDRLQVVVVDDASTDATPALCDAVAAEDERLCVLHVPRSEGARGKAAALDRGLERCAHELIAVFDADARPRPDALRALVAAVADGRHVAAVGRLVKVSRTHNLLTRLAALEYTTFQWTFQAGRSLLFDVVLLTGTNYVVRADVVRALGGWDPRALTEDLDLSARIYAAGHRIAFVSAAVAEDQDPDALGVWFRQRTRWLVGNYYVLFHRTGAAVRSRRARAVAVVGELLCLYVTFLLALVASQALFLGGLTGTLRAPADGVLALLWLLAFGVFLTTIQLTAALDGRDSWRTPLLATVMYLLYCPLWLLVFGRALGLAARRRGRIEWSRTPHFSR